MIRAFLLRHPVAPSLVSIRFRVLQEVSARVFTEAVEAWSLKRSWVMMRQVMINVFKHCQSRYQHPNPTSQFQLTAFGASPVLPCTTWPSASWATMEVQPPSISYLGVLGPIIL